MSTPTKTPDLVVQVRTRRCQRWCARHSLDISETHLYAGVPHYWHRAEPVVVDGQEGQQFTVELLLFEPANNPDDFEPTLEVSGPDPNPASDPDKLTWVVLGDLTQYDARAIATGILELLDRTEGKR